MAEKPRFVAFRSNGNPIDYDFANVFPERVLPLNPVLIGTRISTPSTRINFPSAVPIRAGTEKHGPDFRSTPHREALEIGGDGFSYRFPVLEMAPC